MKHRCRAMCFNACDLVMLTGAVVGRQVCIGAVQLVRIDTQLSRVGFPVDEIR